MTAEIIRFPGQASPHPMDTDAEGNDPAPRDLLEAIVALIVAYDVTGSADAVRRYANELRARMGEEAID